MRWEVHNEITDAVPPNKKSLSIYHSRCCSLRKHEVRHLVHCRMNILAFPLISYQKVFLLQFIILCTILNCKDCSVVSLEHRYGLQKISGHSFSDIRPGITDCHLCMPAGFTYLFFMNCLYNIFVAAVTRGVGLPLKLTNGALLDIIEDNIPKTSPFPNEKPNLKPWFD